MSDLIRREDALKELRLDHKDVIYIDKKECARRIKAIPSADRPRGEWKVFDAEDIGCYNCKCDACGEKFFIPLRKGRVPYYFCPNCGADMRGDNE